MKIIRYWVLAILLAPFGVQAATVNAWIDPTVGGPYNVGDFFTVDIWANWDATILSGGVTLDFDPTVIQIDYQSTSDTGITLVVSHEFLDKTGAPIDNVNGSTGTIGFMQVGLSPSCVNLCMLPSGLYQFATVEFQVVGAGTSLLTLNDALDALVPWENGDDGSDSITFLGNQDLAQSGPVIASVSAVPLPAAAWFMLSGLGFLAFRRRRSV